MGENVEPSKYEGTIYGVDKDTFERASTYPKCLKFSDYVRFLIAPTCCFQLEYPT